MKKRKTKIHYFMFFFIVSIGAFLYLMFFFKMQNLVFEVQSLISIKKELLEENNKLKITYSYISSPINIEKLAKEKLNLIKPSEKQYRFIK